MPEFRDHLKWCEHGPGQASRSVHGIWICVRGTCPGGAKITIDYEAAATAFYEGSTNKGLRNLLDQAVGAAFGSGWHESVTRWIKGRGIVTDVVEFRDHSKSCEHGPGQASKTAYGIWICVRGVCPGGAKVTVDYDAASAAFYDAGARHKDTRDLVDHAVDAALGISDE